MSGIIGMLGTSYRLTIVCSQIAYNEKYKVNTILFYTIFTVDKDNIDSTSF